MYNKSSSRQYWAEIGNTFMVLIKNWPSIGPFNKLGNLLLGIHVLKEFYNNTDDEVF